MRNTGDGLLPSRALNCNAGPLFDTIRRLCIALVSIPAFPAEGR
jgi:hypothetical protein